MDSRKEFLKLLQKFQKVILAARSDHKLKKLQVVFINQSIVMKTAQYVACVVNSFALLLA